MEVFAWISAVCPRPALGVGPRSWFVIFTLKCDSKLIHLTRSETRGRIRHLNKRARCHGRIRLSVCLQHQSFPHAALTCSCASSGTALVFRFRALKPSVCGRSLMVTRLKYSPLSCSSFWSLVTTIALLLMLTVLQRRVMASEAFQFVIRSERTGHIAANERMQVCDDNFQCAPF